MALANGKFKNDGPLIFLSTQSKTVVEGKEVEIEPRFLVSRVGADGKIAKTDETYTEISGDLTKIDFKEREFNGKASKHAVLYIKDGKETYHLDLTYRISTRSLFNALLALENADGIKISVYRSKKGYESFALRQGDELVKWKHELATLPKADELRDKKGVLVKTDYTEVDTFFENELKELSIALFGKQVAKKEVVKQEAVAEKTEAKDDTDQVPF